MAEQVENSESVEDFNSFLLYLATCLPTVILDIVQNVSKDFDSSRGSALEYMQEVSNSVTAFKATLTQYFLETFGRILTAHTSLVDKIPEYAKVLSQIDFQLTKTLSELWLDAAQHDLGNKQDTVKRKLSMDSRHSNSSDDMLQRISSKPRFQELILTSVCTALEKIQNAPNPQHTSQNTNPDQNPRSVQPSVHTSQEETKQTLQPTKQQSVSDSLVDSILLQSMEEACTRFNGLSHEQIADACLENLKDLDIRTVKDSVILKFFVSANYRNVRDIFIGISKFSNESKFLIAFIYSISLVNANSVANCLIIELKLTSNSPAEFGRFSSSKRQLQRLVFLGSGNTWHLSMSSFKGKKEKVEPSANHPPPDKSLPTKNPQKESQPMPKKQKPPRGQKFLKANSHPDYYQVPHGPGCRCPECYSDQYYGGYWDPQYYGAVGNKSGAGPYRQ